MKQKEINEFGMSVVAALMAEGIPSGIQESNKSNSIYVHVPLIGEEVRISDHGFTRKRYNFSSSKKSSRFVDGYWMFPMTYEGIDDFINVVKEEFPDLEPYREGEEYNASKVPGDYVICYKNDYMSSPAYLQEEPSFETKKMNRAYKKMHLDLVESQEGADFLKVNYSKDEAHRKTFCIPPTKREFENAIGTGIKKKRFYIMNFKTKRIIE